MASTFSIGIDLGNQTSRIAVYRGAGRTEVIGIGEDFVTSSLIAFTPHNRIIGNEAKNQLITSLRNTIFGFKRLLGKNFDDPAIEHELRDLPYNFTRCKDGTIGVKVRYLNNDQIFNMKQVTAMFFSQLKETAEAALECKINECVLSVPSYFDNIEKLSLLDAASIAGLKVLKILNDTTAASLTYGIEYQEKLSTEESSSSRNVVFVDCGHTSFQVSVCSFDRGKLKILASAADSQLGGRDIDIVLAEHFCEDFKSKYDIDSTKNTSAMLRLLGEVEQLKKKMSSNSTELSLHIKSFMNDKDLQADMKRVDMEELCAELFERVETVLRKCLQESELQKDEIHFIEIVGGSTRVPAIKSLIEKVFGKVSSTTLNPNEAVARGCALQCAMLRSDPVELDFAITDVQNYPIKMVVNLESDEDGRPREIEICDQNHIIPFSRTLNFYRREPFAFTAVYAQNNRLIGKFFVNDVKPDAEGGPQKVKVKAYIDINGIFRVISATLFEKKEVEANSGHLYATEDQLHAEPLKKKRRTDRCVNSIELPIKVELVGAYTSSELNKLIETERKMVSTDRLDARHVLEKYINDIRLKLPSSDELAPFVSMKERKELRRHLEDVEGWLQEKGENFQRHECLDKLKALQESGEPIKKRKNEYEIIPRLVKEFKGVLLQTRELIYEYIAGAEKYSHLQRHDIEKVRESIDFAGHWIEEMKKKLSKSSKHHDPPVSSEQIKNEKNHFEQTITKILSKPKSQSFSAYKMEEDIKCVTKTYDESGFPVDMFKKILDTFGEQLSAKIAQQFNAVHQRLKDEKCVTDNLVQTTTCNTLPFEMTSFVEEFCENIFPRFDDTCQETFDQLNNSFIESNKKVVTLWQSKIDEFIVRLENMMKAASADAVKNVAQEIINPMKVALEQQRTYFENSLLDVSSSSTPLPGNLKRHSEEHIDFLINQGKVDVAIEEVLSASDLKPLMYLCEKVDPEILFTEPCPIEQNVVLMLIEKLSADLSIQADLKLNFIERAVMCLDKKHPICEKNLPKILPAVRNQILNYVKTSPINKNNHCIKIVLMAIDLLYKESSSSTGSS